MKKFSLLHLALYSKNWYKKCNKQSIWDDLKVILTLDGYGGEYFTNGDITRVILTQCQHIEMNAFKSMYDFAIGVSKDDCWKYGYYTKGNTYNNKKDSELPEYDYNEAIVRYCISNLMMTELSEFAKHLPMPDYKKGLRRPDGVSKKKLKEMFA